MDLTTAHIMARSHGFKRKTVKYQKAGAPDEADPHMAADTALARKVGETLQRHYADHPWLVEVDHAQGVVMISLPIVMPRNRKMIIHTSTLAADPQMRAVVRAGGEILERYNIPRSGFTLDPFLEARAANPINRRAPRLIVA